MPDPVPPATPPAAGAQPGQPVPAPSPVAAPPSVPSAAEPGKFEVVLAPPAIEIVSDVPPLAGAQPLGPLPAEATPPPATPPAPPVAAPPNPFAQPPVAAPPAPPAPPPAAPAAPAENMSIELDPAAFAVNPSAELARIARAAGRMEAQKAIDQAETSRVAGQIVARVQANFGEGAKHYDAVVAPHAAMRDTRVAGVVGALIQQAQENAMRDPRMSEAFNRPAFFRRLVDQAIEQVGWTPPASVATPGTTVLQSAGGQGTPSASTGRLTEEERQIARSWGLTDEEFARNKALATGGF